MGTHPIFESDFDCLTDSDLFGNLNCLTWRTQHQPRAMPDSAVVSAVVAVDAAVAEEAVVVVANAAAVARRNPKNGNQSPSSVASSRRARSPSWRRSTPLPFQSRSSRSSITLSVQPSRTRSSRSSPSRNRPVPVSVLASRLLSLSVARTVTSVLASSAPRKLPPPSVVLSSLPSSLLSQSVVVTGVTSWVNPTLFPVRSMVNVVPSQRNLCKWLVLRMSTLPLVVVPQPWATLPR